MNSDSSSLHNLSEVDPQELNTNSNLSSDEQTEEHCTEKTAIFLWEL